MQWMRPRVCLRPGKVADAHVAALAEDLVHYLCALGERRPYLVAVDRLSRGCGSCPASRAMLSTGTPFADRTDIQVTT